MKRHLLAAATFIVAGCGGPRPMHRHDAVVVMSPVRLEGVVVRGANKGWYLTSNRAAFGEPVPVLLTNYCLRGTTRRGRYVRPGIVAADPKFFPMARYLELYVGRKYLGRFLIDDTGGKIKRNHIDIWVPSCRDARRFGLQRGTAVLVPKLPEVRLAGTAGARKP
jgi:3D (Asp-Asp-Asp) domain-containing protein